MEFKLIIDQDRKEEVIIYARAENQLVKEIRDLVVNDSCLIAYKDDAVIKISPSEVYCFTIENNKLYAIMEKERLQIKQRLYQVEELLGSGFVKINQSSIANISKVERFRASIGGSLVVIFKNGYKDYISRRQAKIVKERFGL